MRERGTPEQKAVCDRLWAGGFRHRAPSCEAYYQAMGPLYSRRYDPAAAAATRGAAIHSPDAINRAFGPDGFLRRARPAAGAGADHRADADPGRPARLDLPAGVLRGDPPPDPGLDLRIFEDSSHSIRVDEPEALRAAIAGFVAG